MTARCAAAGLLVCLLLGTVVAARDCYGPNCLQSSAGAPNAEDIEGGMGRILPSAQQGGTVEAEQLAQTPSWGVDDSAGDLASSIVNFLGLPGEDEDTQDNEGELDNAPENDLQVGESADTDTKNKTKTDDKKADKKKGDDKKATNATKTSGSHEHELTPAKKVSTAAKRKVAMEKNEKKRVQRKAKRAKAEANEHKQKNAMPSPPPRKDQKKRGKVLRLGNMEFVSEKIDSNTLHAKLTLSGRDIKGKTLNVDGHTNIDGALHLRGKGDLLHSKVTGKSFRATVFVNKKDVKSCGLAISNEGGFFDHNDGFITYEPLDGKHGFKVNSELRAGKKIHAEGGLHIGGTGSKLQSKITKRFVQQIMHTNINDVKGGGFAVSKAGGFFDFKDGSITYEPLEGSHGLQINSPFKVIKDAHFKGDVRITGKLHLEGEINVGIAKGQHAAFDSHFSKFHTQHNKLQARVDELESSNAALVERLERMEAMMQTMQK